MDIKSVNWGSHQRQRRRKKPLVGAHKNHFSRLALQPTKVSPSRTDFYFYFYYFLLNLLQRRSSHDPFFILTLHLILASSFFSSHSSPKKIFNNRALITYNFRKRKTTLPCACIHKTVDNFQVIIQFLIFPLFNIKFFSHTVLSQLFLDDCKWRACDDSSQFLTI